MRIEIPKKFRWLARDESEGWYVYVNRPEPGTSVWEMPDGMALDYEPVPLARGQIKNWRKTLHRRSKTNPDEWERVDT